MLPSIALIASTNRQQEILELVNRHQKVLNRYNLIAPLDIGQYLQNQAGLSVECVRSLSDGGDIELAACILSKTVVGVIALIDADDVLDYESGLRNLWRACILQDIPFSTNLSTAELVLRGAAKHRLAYLIFNPVAGQGNPDQELALIRQLLEPQIQLNVIFTEKDVDPAEQAKAAIAKIQANQTDGPTTDLIIASGGDGTVSVVAGATIGTGIPIGIIPRGTANAFSVGLGIPTDLRGACQTILSGNTRVVDAAMCNDVPMLLLAGIGFEAGMVDRADRTLKDRLGTLAYVLAGVQQFTQQERFKAQVEIEGEVTELETGAITIANVAPSGSVLAQGSGQVIPDDGLLEVTIGTTQTRVQAIGAMTSLFAAAIRKMPTNRDDILCLQTPRIKVSTTPPQKVVVDGEIIGTTPIDIQCIPSGLTVFAPISQV
ncbi:MAG: YegS/Rv2252/BmrU family lipid kinase [Synechococcales cyanobacterium T60_A2020_003]|nr:YegS/Rv2252/BmrU family lipid kinase [Synechococcales cyanobacterium T60_A2020_003]